MDSVCRKCKKASICEPASKSDMWDLVSLEKSQNTLGKIRIHMAKIMIYTIMNPCVHSIILILFKIYYKWQHCFALWLQNNIFYHWVYNSFLNNISIQNILLVSGHLWFMILPQWKSQCAYFISYVLVSEKCQLFLMVCMTFIYGTYPMNLWLLSWNMEYQ